MKTMKRILSNPKYVHKVKRIFRGQCNGFLLIPRFHHASETGSRLSSKPVPVWLPSNQKYVNVKIKINNKSVRIVYAYVSSLMTYAFLACVRPVPLGSIPSALVGVSVIGQWFLPGYCSCSCWGPYLLVSNSLLIIMYSSLVLCANESK